METIAFARQSLLISMDEFHELEHLDYILHPSSLEFFFSENFHMCTERNTMTIVGVGERKVFPIVTTDDRWFCVSLTCDDVDVDPLDDNNISIITIQKLPNSAEHAFGVSALRPSLLE